MSRASSAFSQSLQRVVLAADAVECPQQWCKALVKARTVHSPSARKGRAANALRHARDGSEIQGDLMAHDPSELFEVHKPPFSEFTIDAGSLEDFIHLWPHAPRGRRCRRRGSDRDSVTVGLVVVLPAHAFEVLDELFDLGRADVHHHHQDGEDDESQVDIQGRVLRSTWSNLTAPSLFGDPQSATSGQPLIRSRRSIRTGCRRT